MKQIWNKIVCSAYCDRLRKRSWILGLILVSQLILALYYLGYTYSLGDMGVAEALGLSLYSLVHVGAWAVGLWLIAGVPSSRIGSKAVLGLTAIVSIFVFLVEVVLLMEYKTLYNVDLALLLISTSSREAGESFSIIRLSSFMWAGLGTAVSVLLSVFINKLISRSRTMKGVLGTALAALIIGGLAFIPVVSAHINERVIPSLYTTSFDRAVLSTGYGYWLSLKVEKRYAAMKNLESLNDLKVEDEPFKEPIDIVFILGESVSRNYMHCYNYPVANTPTLDSLERDSSLVLFRDVIAPATTTNYSCQRTLTYYTQNEGKGDWYEYPNLLATVKKAGWATAWVTNQETTGIYSVSRIFSPFADVVRERHSATDTNEHGLNNLRGSYDEGLLPLLQSYAGLPDSLRKQSPRGLFEVIHLMGSHFDYAKRFPDEFARFKASDLPRRLGKDKDRVVANYLNSIYYTDYVIKQIVQRYAQKPTLIFYMSDHGEILYDNPEDPDFYGHSPYAITSSAVSIPFMVYMSPSLKQQYPQLLSLFKEAQNRRISSDLLTHTLTSFLGIKTRFNTPELNFLGAQYNESRPRMVTATEGGTFEFKDK